METCTLLGLAALLQCTQCQTLVCSCSVSALLLQAIATVAICSHNGADTLQLQSKVRTTRAAAAGLCM